MLVCLSVMCVQVEAWAEEAEAVQRADGKRRADQVCVCAASRACVTCGVLRAQNPKP